MKKRKLIKRIDELADDVDTRDAVIRSLWMKIGQLQDDERLAVRRDEAVQTAMAKNVKLAAEIDRLHAALVAVVEKSDPPPLPLNPADPV